MPSTFNEVDSTAVKALTAISNEMRNKYRVRLLIANVRGAVRDVFDKLKFTKVIGIKVCRSPVSVPSMIFIRIDNLSFAA